MPTPDMGESKPDFLDRCIPMVMDDGSADGQDQAVAMCSTMWEDAQKAAPKVSRAYSVLNIKSFDDEQRIIEGIATTPTPDRAGDIVVSKGAKFNLPMPLLWQHDSRQPIGQVTYAKATDNGIPFRAQIAKSDQPGTLRDRLDEAWQSIKLGLVRAVSIGFQPIKYKFLKEGGMQFDEWEFLELSAVTIPANIEATINVIRSFDQARDRAITDLPRDRGDKATTAGASAFRKSTKLELAKMSKRTIADQIKDWEATLASHETACKELLAAADERGETLDGEEASKYEEHQQKVKDVSAHLGRLREQEKKNMEDAKAAKPTNGSSVEIGNPVQINTRQRLEKGITFARGVIALAQARGAPLEALEIAKQRWGNETPEVMSWIKQSCYRKDAVPGTSTELTGSWADQLVYPVTQGFLDLLMPETIFGKINGWNRVPFNVRVPIQTGGGTVNWVGEAAAKPVGEMTFDTVTLTYSKIAGIVVLSDELVRLSSPSAETTVRNQLVRDVAKFMDEQLLTTSITETASRPASITQSVTPDSASGTDLNAFLADMNTALAHFDSADASLNNVVIVTTPALARAIAGFATTLGVAKFPSMGPRGGTIDGFPVIVSNSCPSGSVIFIDPTQILLADDGQVTIDASNQATLDMGGGDTPAFSLWQKNCVGIRAERWIRYKKARDSAVAMIGSAAYVAGTQTI